MTVYERQCNNTIDLICKAVLTKNVRCAACEKLKQYTKHSKMFSSAQTLLRHIHQCSNYDLISYPKKQDAIIALEEICLAMKNNTPLTKTVGYKLGMIVK